jgi:two-component system, NtrC family, response regulator AtoC
MAHAVLIIEDEAILAKNMKTYLERQDFEAAVAASGEEGLAKLDAFHPDVVLLDYHLPGMDGLETLARMRERDRGIKVIMLTGHASVRMAVDAMKAGAYDYLNKPVVLSELKLLLDKALGEGRLEQELSYYRKQEAGKGGLEQLLGESPAMRRLKGTLEQVLEAGRRLAGAGMPAALITGETGTGKELVARALHFGGPRAGKPFIELNCASIPSQLLESELFGYERGAFTDARGRKAGLVEAAHGGTLFLDEIGDIELGLQGKLLKLLEEKSLRRLGSLRELQVDVRVVAATNQPLESLVREGKFRSDLFFRLRGVQLAMPPLRERGDDVLLLARHFLQLNAARYGKKGLRFSPPAEATLLGYAWPGNVRELRNVVEEAVLLAQDELIVPQQLSFCASLGATPAAAPAPAVSADIPDAGINLEEVERGLVVQALQKTGWNVTRAARLLGLTRDTLRYRMEKFGLSAPQRSAAAGGSGEANA